MEERIRIKDIADRAGVSVGTVDRVIHERGNVSPDTRKRVREVMEELGYEPNILASRLAYNRVLRIAVLLPDPAGDPYWEQPRLGIERARQGLQHYGLKVELNDFDLFDSQSFLQAGSRILASTALPDAFLFAPVFLKESRQLLRQCHKKGIPTVMINTRIKSEDALCYIGQDSYQSGVLAGRLLNFGLADGETALVLNLDKNSTNAQHLIDKEKGFRDYFNNNRQKQIRIVKKDFEDFHDDQKMRAFLIKLFEEQPMLKGIFVTNSRAYRAVENIDPVFLQKIKIVGYDLIAPNLRLLQDNKISFIINQNPAQQGYLGITKLVSHLVLKKQPERDLYLPLDIVVRENVEYYLRQETEVQFVI